MSNSDNQIDQLLKKLEILISKQQVFSSEINALKDEIEFLKSQKSILDESPEITDQKSQLIKEIPEEKPIIQNPVKATPLPKPPQKKNTYKSKNIEKYIGENLINKIGIIITVIGVGIGTKYAINHQLISPLTRIILGYLLGIGLLGFAYKLKKKYHAYSAVLLSGGMAILYFISYAAYSFYGLMPQSLTFVLMVLFTVFTVLAALHYNQQIIALLGLAGAYTIPFLLSDDTGNIRFLLSYILLVNIGILYIAFKKYWKPLYYVAFIFTWLIFFQWYDHKYNLSIHFNLAITFLLLFFLVFYLTFLAYKLIQKEVFQKIDIILILFNSFIFFGLGYDLLRNNPNTEEYLGLFAIVNAVIHFGISMLIYKQKLGDKQLFYFITGLVLVFLTLAIPIQLDGNWVTLLWIGEAALLYWIGRTKNISFYEKLAYPLLFLGFISLLIDWGTFYNHYQPTINTVKLTPLWNVQFLTSILVIGALGFMNYVQKDRTSALGEKSGFFKVASYAIPILFIVVLYLSFRMEITNYWHQRLMDSRVSLTDESAYSFTQNNDLRKFKSIWVINYSLLFFSLLTYFANTYYKNKIIPLVTAVLNMLVLFIFLLQGLYLFSELRDSYLNQSLADYYAIGSFHIWIRYISFVFVAVLLLVTNRFIAQKSADDTQLKVFELIVLGTILWISSSELISWMNIFDAAQSYKFGLSILWGSYSLLLIVLGIWKKIKHFRIAGIVLFALTLLKLFFYDISDLNTLSKTIAFVLLGILLLVISFLYNKYKQLIFDEDDEA